jgi:hypothetical protein
MNIENKQFTDKYELYSYSTYLYFYAFFYIYLFEYNLLQGLLINIVGNTLFYYIFGYNIITFMGHKYWKYNLNTISMPQLFSCASNIVIHNYINVFNNKYDILIIFPLNVISNIMIKNMYKNEISYSRNLRFVIAMIFLFFRIIF